LIHKEFEVKVPLKELFTNIVLEQQARLIRQARRSAFSDILPVPVQPDYPLSPSQRRLWVLSLFDDGNMAYNMPGVYVFEGELELTALIYAFNELIKRHEILRTLFKENEQGDVRQYIQSPSATGFKIDQYDLRHDPERLLGLHKLVQEEIFKPFDLTTGPLLRAGLYRVANNKWIFTYVMHHIIGDGWSMGILIKELLLNYNACIKGIANPLPPLRIQYKDYAAWQLEQLSEHTSSKHKDYWLNQFEGELPVLELPYDKIRPAVKTYNGGIVNRIINATVSRGIKDLSQQQGGTLFMGLLATVNTLLYRYTNQEDIIIGTPIAGREHIDLENQIGFYINTLALRARFNGKDSFAQLLEHIKQVTLEAYEHQLYPFDELVDALKLQRDMSRSALFDVMVVLQNTDIGNVDGQQLDALTINEYSGLADKVSKFDLCFNFTEWNGELQLHLEYNSDIYANSTVERLADHLNRLMELIVAHPSVPIQLLDYLSAEEKHQLIAGFNDTAAAYPKDKTVVELFEEQVAITPAAIALICGEVQLSYQRLNEQANKLAGYLRQHYNIQSDDLIGIKLERSEWMIIAILGVLKSGGAYVPIDIEYPQDRIDHIIADSQCKVLIDEDELEKFRTSQNKYSGENLPLVHRPHNLAYVIYTSGTTGMPKGAMIEHRSLAARIVYLQQTYAITGADNLIFYRSYSFDGSIEEYLMPVMTGAKCYIAPGDFKQDILNNIIRFVESNKITKINMPPVVLGELVLMADKNIVEKLSSLKHVVSGGDLLTAKIVNEFLVKFTASLYNSYGPTENTIDSTNWLADRSRRTANVPIGKPVQNSQVYILDNNLQLVPVGVCGELYVSGAGLGRGYLNNPELSAEKFIPHPFIPGGRMYKTGDLGKWLADGNIEFTGRKDNQVKIRGYRIEMGEIENALQSHPDVESAVVIARPNQHGDKEIVAYVISKGTINVPEIRSYMSKTLPTYMLPAYFVQLDSLPLTHNGKLDKRKLPDPKDAGMAGGVEYVAPRNEIEEKLVSIWQEILGKERIGVKDNFFELGGHSLKVAQLISRINMIFLVRINIQSIFQEPVIENIGEQIAFILEQQKQKQQKSQLIQIDI
jgi:amino acid adenylation domain-containing protein